MVLPGMFGGVACCNLWTDHDVADQVVAMIGVRTVERERQHIGRTILAAMFTVEVPDRRLIDKQQRALTGNDALIDEGSRRQFRPAIQIDRNHRLLVDCDDEGRGGRRRLAHEPSPARSEFEDAFS